jgi:hypothetical protein
MEPERKGVTSEEGTKRPDRVRVIKVPRPDTGEYNGPSIAGNGKGRRIK